MNKGRKTHNFIMSDLPNDLWRKIFDLGINNTTLTYKDLCSISITCTRLYRLSSEDSLWSHLLSSDFPSPITIKYSWDPQETASKYSSSSSAKSQYKIRCMRMEKRRLFLERERGFAQFCRECLRYELELWERRRAAVEKKNLCDILSVKIQEREWAKEKKTRKATIPDLLNSSYSTKANSRGFQRVPDKCYLRETRSKAFTQQKKGRHR